MKRKLRILAISFAVLVALIFGIGVLLPGEIALETQAELDGTPEQLWPQLTTFDGLKRWWAPKGEMELVHTAGPTRGAELQLDFVSAGRVSESWTLTRAEPMKVVVYEVDFKMFVVERTLTLTQSEGKTKVHWRETGETSNPIMKWLLLVSSGENTIENFDRALEALVRASGQPGTPPERAGATR